VYHFCVDLLQETDTVSSQNSKPTTKKSIFSTDVNTIIYIVHASNQSSIYTPNIIIKLNSMSIYLQDVYNVSL